MVGWYNPGQLVRTAIEVAISTIFGRHSDHRLVEAMAGADGPAYFDYTCEPDGDGAPDRSRPRESIWIDYVGDVGDGWNPTYAIASHLAEERRTFDYVDSGADASRSVTTERGAILIFGGDEVYPTASQAEYKARLLAPYDAALPSPPRLRPDAFAIPGNHDWYDSLVSFTRLFTSQRSFAGWRTRQTRSYFALKLPHNWWLLGTDVQLGSDIDAPQVNYFTALVPEMQAETARTGKPASIILCHAEPHWIRAAQYGGLDPNYNESNLKLFERRLGKDVAVFIAGDLHHYRRHEAQDGSAQKITAGGGGAFLHPTHVGMLGTKLDTIEERDGTEASAADPSRIFQLRASFPPTEVSRRLCWRNLYFPFLPRSENRTLGVATAMLYLVIAMAVLGDIDDYVGRAFSPLTVLGATIRQMLNSGVTAAIVALVIVGFIFFTDTHSRPYRLIMGGLHGLVHVLAAFTLTVASVWLVAHLMDASTWVWQTTRLTVPIEFDARIAAAVVLVLLAGYLIGPFILGMYLLVSLNFFGRHSNEAFSSLAVEDWKNCLRLHIDASGDLTIYPIGIERVPRRWTARGAGGSGPRLVSDDPSATAPALIEPPIVIRRANTKTGVATSAPPPLPGRRARADELRGAQRPS